MSFATLRGSASSRALILALSAPLAVAVPLSAACAGGALPSSGQYVAGSGTIAKAGKSGLTIDQSSATGIIDWNSFSIGRKNSVTFDNGSGATLNRVTGGNLSTIAGSLKATGSLYLINPQGMIVSGTGRVLTGGNFVGSSRDLSDDDFTHGKRRFTGTSKGAVVNQGTIRSSNGDVALIGSSASNSGILSASHGSASLDAGDNILLAPAGSNGRIMVSGGSGDVRNSGTIAAAQAQLNAAGGNVYALSGNNGGIVRATGTSTIGGHVWLTSNSGNVNIGGTVAATNANGSGGVVTARAGNIAISGIIDASARSAGHKGGAVHIVSTGTTKVDGTIKATGGRRGTGGEIETSGHTLIIGGNVDAGDGGQWLLDPYDLTVDSTAATTIDNSLGAGTSVELQTTSKGTSGPGDVNASGNGDIIIDAGLGWSTSAVFTLDAYRNIDIDAPITSSGAGKLTLTSAGAIAQSSAGIITAAEITGSSVGDTALTAANKIGILGGFTSSAAFSLTDSQSLTVNGTLNVAACCAALQTTEPGDNLTIDAAIKDLKHTVTLISAGRIAQSSTGIITAGGLTGSSVGGTVLRASNQVAKLENFTNTGKGGIALTNSGQALTVDGVVNAGAGTLSLIATGAYPDASQIGRDLTITNSLVTTGTVNLISSGTVAESGAGKITAGILEGASGNGATLNGANHIDVLDAFTNSDIAGIFLTDNQSLKVAGAVDADMGGVTLVTTGAGHNLTIANVLTSVVGGSSGNAVTLISAGTISEGSAGAIDTFTLTGSSAGGTALNGANLIDGLSTFTNTGGGGFALKNEKTLTVLDAVDAGSGNIALTVTGAGHELNLFNGRFTTLGRATFISSGDITQEAGPGSYIQAEALTGSAAGEVVLAGDNAIPILDTFSSGKGGFSFNDVDDLTIDAAFNTGTNNLSITVQGVGNNLVFTKPLSGATVTLSAAASLTESGTIIHATTLYADAGVDGNAVASDAILTGANVVANLAGGAGSDQYYGGTFTFVDTSSVVLKGGGAGTAFHLTTKGAGHGISVDGDLTVFGGTGQTGVITLNSAGSITETRAGLLFSGDVLQGTSVGGASFLLGNNQASLGNFTNSGGGGFRYSSETDMSITGTINAGTGNLSISSDFGIGLSGSLVTGGTLSLSASDGDIEETQTGAITVGTLAASAFGEVNLGWSNDIVDLGTVNGGLVNIADKRGLTITGTVQSDHGSVNIRTTAGNIAIQNLVSADGVQFVSNGTVTESGAGRIKASQLGGSSVGGTALNGDNAIGALSDFTNTGEGNFALTNSQALTVAGAVSIASNTGVLSLATTAGNLTIDGSLTAPVVTLRTAGEALEGSDGSIVATGTLNVTAQTGIDLNSSLNYIHSVGTRQTKSGLNIIAGIGL